MKFKRNHENDWKVYYVFLALLGMMILLWGIFKLSFLWNILTFPLGLFLLARSFRRYRKENFVITEIDFKSEITSIQLMNNDVININNDKLMYAILVKKFYKPIRAIEIRQKRKINISRGKLIGQIEIKEWDNIEDIAKYFIQTDFKRLEWKFSFNWANLLMIFAILLGTSESQAELYVGDIDSGVPDLLGETGQLLADKKVNEIENSEKAKKRFLNKNKKNDE